MEALVVARLWEYIAAPAAATAHYAGEGSSLALSPPRRGAEMGYGGSGGTENPAAAVGIGIALGTVKGDSNFCAPDDFDGLLGPVPQG